MLRRPRAVELLFAMMFCLSVSAKSNADDEETELIYLVFTPKCFGVFMEGLDQLFVKMDVGGCIKKINYYMPCALQIISKTLGYGILVFSMVLKLPQIIKIVRSKSVFGLSPSSFYLEVLVFVCSSIYNVRLGYPLSSYGENIIILTQNVVLVLLLWVYANPPVGLKDTGLVMVMAAGVVISAFMLPLGSISYLQTAATTLAVFGRVPQLWRNFSQGNTGQLSSITIALNLLGNIARIFTTIQETNDRTILASFLIATTLNFLLLLQIVVYRSATKAANLAISKQRAGKAQ